MTDRRIGILGLFKKDKQQDEIFKGWHYKAIGPAGKTVVDVKVLETKTDDPKRVLVELPNGEQMEIVKSTLIDDHFGKIVGREE